MGVMEQFEQNEEEHFEMPQTAVGVEDKLRDYQIELESSRYEDLSVQEKNELLDKIEKELSLIDSSLDKIFVNPKEDSDYLDLKELIDTKKELVYKKRRPLLH